IVRQLGNPIVTTSLDISERTFASDPMDFMEFYEDRVDLIIHAGPSYHDPSTIIDFTTDQPRLLRAGQGDISWITS
ncbi:MAG: threonylcarbamoyl-AMP synthase, partial [Candidatus Marinimicrobia bacterium CG_4_10_14_0_2_um_filter_48_9]